ncbi:hypothetical protein DBR11_09785 [Pedobacter sp. HMWF019]|uniref:hypothetical protein n=1 Tax=Pedobacter sp. HMWF019 TaxID=2056856 RepID=UPI000D36CA5D|nr:hypothetical protein [Pedobacter sp. HMWF019]PTT00493.1 hypothetical protein DBR11_09785 [Pedobacter sp. HMWF019]
MTLLESKIYWAYERELSQEKSWLKSIMGLFSFVPPLHAHEGKVCLSERSLEITGDENLSLPLHSIEEVYLGFDDVFPASSVKNFGLFWQPLRLRFNNDEVIYMIADYNGIKTNNQIWYETLKEILQ